MFSSDEVAAIARALKDIDVHALKDRFDDDALAQAEIYPLHGSKPDPDFKEYVTANYRSLRELVQTAATGGLGLLVWMN